MLVEKYASHHGKLSDKWTIYLQFYDEVLKGIQKDVSNILEIGVQNGGSLEIWASCLPHATRIVGCDINPRCALLRFEDPRINVIVADANTDEAENAIVGIAPHFDVIVDDGSHLSNDIVRSFARYFPRLHDGGVYIVEDLHCSYWEDFEGGLHHPMSSMSFFKQLSDIVNHEHWGVSASRRQLLERFEAAYGVQFDDESLAHIYSVTFANSMCVIRRRAPENTLLGGRVITGEDALVETGVSQLSGTHNIVPSQAANPWIVDERTKWTMREEGWRLVQEEQRSEIYSLQQALDSHEHRMLHLDASLASVREQLHLKENDLHHLARAHDELNSALHASRQELDAMRSSRSWKIAAPIRSLERLEHRITRVTTRLSRVKSHEGGVGRMVRKSMKALVRSGPGGLRNYLKRTEAQATGQHAAASGVVVDLEEVARQIFREQQAQFSQETLRLRAAGFAHQPLISIIMPVYKTPVQWLARVIESLQEQIYENWELCAVDDCSPTEDQRRVLQDYASRDTRVRFQVAESNGGISAASNIALDMAQGEYVALVDHDDELTPDALFWMVEKINEVPESDFLYSDECKIDDTPAKRLFHFIFKPQWSPEMMFNGMLTGHLTVYRSSLVREVGCFRSLYDFSQDYDLALRMGEKARRVTHVERVLYLWRSIPGSAAAGGKDFARESNVAALEDFLKRSDYPAHAVALPHANCVEVTPRGKLKPSVVIPSDSYENLKKAIDALLRGTDFDDYEVVAVCNSPLADRLAQEFSSASQIVFSRYDKKYNFSDKCNQGARDATGDIVIFYNDDVFPIGRDWMHKIVEYLYLPGVGGVSPKLLYADETIQYAGMIAGTPGLCGTAYNHVHRDGSDAFLSMHKYVRNVSILSGACCALKRELFMRIGGFDAVNAPDGHSDMDLSFKVMEAGYRCVYTPYSVLYHIGHGSWGGKKGKYKADIFALKRWGGYVAEDPYFTDSMKRVLYADFRFHYKIYPGCSDSARTYRGPDVLFVSHELTLTGAPRMLFHAAQAVLSSGGFPVVVAPQDGPMRDEFVNAGITVIVDESVPHDHFLFGGFAKNFDVVVVNTVALIGVIRQLQEIEGLDIIWWVHEAKALQEVLVGRHDIEPKKLRLLAVSKYAAQYIPPAFDVNILYNGVPDKGRGTDGKGGSDKFTFVMLGTVEPRKGQDIFASAIMLLPEEVRARSSFKLGGKLWDMHVDFWAEIEKKTGMVKGFEYLGELSHADSVKCLSEADILVCCSRDDPFPLVVIEAAMLGKPAIISSDVGSAEVFEHGVSCFKFASEDAADLAAQMNRAFLDWENLKQMGSRARHEYDSHFTIQKFSENFLVHIVPGAHRPNFPIVDRERVVATLSS